MAEDRFSIIRPDDWHLHVRDGAVLETVIHHSAAQFRRAIIMPNLKPPIRTTEEALAYRDRIMQALHRQKSTGLESLDLQHSDFPSAGFQEMGFQPLMTLYLTDQTSPEEIKKAKAAGIQAVKYYPAGATTNSEYGLTAIENAFPVFEAMSREDMPLLLHGEVTDPAVDIFDREKVFVDTVLSGLLQQFPDLRIVLEHITTAHAAEFIEKAAENTRIAATVTPQHLLMNRNAIFRGGIRPHHFCLPILKRENDREKIISLVTSGNPRFFAGTDSAPHVKSTKENSCGCAGIYSAFSAIELYAEAFYQAGLFQDTAAREKDRLCFENFMSRNGATFYNMPVNQGTVTLVRNPWQVPESFDVSDDSIVPLYSGQTIMYQLE